MDDSSSPSLSNPPFLMKRRNFLLTAPVILGGCTTAITSATDGTQLTAGQGVLALHLSANDTAFLTFNPYGESTFGTRFTENMIGAKGGLRLMDGERFVVLPMDAGPYMWSKLTRGNQFAWLQSSTFFSVRPATITYIGHLRIHMSSGKYLVQVRDREAEMKEHLQAYFPGYFKTLPFEKSISDVRIRT
jgi:hypothetical protein